MKNIEGIKKKVRTKIEVWKKNEKKRRKKTEKKKKERKKIGVEILCNDRKMEKNLKKEG